VISPSQRLLHTQHTINTRDHHSYPCPGGFRNHIPSKRKVAEPRGHWNRQIVSYYCSVPVKDVAVTKCELIHEKRQSGRMPRRVLCLEGPKLKSRTGSVLYCLWLSPSSSVPLTECQCSKYIKYTRFLPWPLKVNKGKALPLQAWTGPEGSRRLRLPDFKTFDTWRW
jgi:hypothetical protein